MVKQDGEVSFSGIKLVTHDNYKVSVSFRDFNPMALYIIEENRDKYLLEIMKEMYNLLYMEGICHSQIQYSYYSGTVSIGEYYIADLYVENIINKFIKQNDDNGKYIMFEYTIGEKESENLRDNYDTIIEKYVSIGKMINVSTDENNIKYKIYIDNESNPTTADKNCIIAAFCGNKSYSEFAAEVSFHADMLVNWLIGRIFYSNAIVADMTCCYSGSDGYINWKLGSESSGYTKKQREASGKEYDYND